MLIQYLITFVGKTKQEIINALDSFDIRGSVLVGNQMSEMNSCEIVKTKNYTATIFNMTSRGVSKNRNFLLKHSEAEYVTFLDDDMHFIVNKQDELVNTLEQRKYNCVRFNVVSINKDRPIKQLKKEGYVGFHKLTSFGVWGCFFKRVFLINNGLLFNENVGPGTNINHGEDGLFLRHFTSIEKIYSIPTIVFTIKQMESTWHSDANRDLEKELFSHGYLYHLIYQNEAILMSALFLITHKNCFPNRTNRFKLFKYMKNGINASKQEYRKGK